jgi:hypothetical protein
MFTKNSEKYGIFLIMFFTLLTEFIKFFILFPKDQRAWSLQGTPGLTQHLQRCKVYRLNGIRCPGPNGIITDFAALMIF